MAGGAETIQESSGWETNANSCMGQKQQAKTQRLTVEQGSNGKEVDYRAESCS